MRNQPASLRSRATILSRASSSRRRNVRRARRMLFESLEQRTVLASSITILDAGVGSLDGFLGPSDGSITVADGGAVPGTLSRAALQGVGATVNIDITAGTSIIVNDLTSPLTLQTGAANSATFTASAGSLTFTDTSDSLTTAGGDLSLVAAISLTLGGLASGGGDIALRADDVDINQSINAGAGRVSIAGFVTARDINVGTETAGQLSLTDAELDLVSAAVLQIGAAGTGNIDVSAFIDAPAGYNTLSLISGDAIADSTGSLFVSRLRASATNGVTLNSVLNNVTFLAGTVTTAGGDFTYVDATGFTIDTVDGLAGINTVATADLITLTAGGAVTQTAGANVASTFLQLLGTGPYILNNTGNDVVNIAANLTAAGTGTLSYTDSDALNIGFAGATDGITTNNSNVSVTSGAVVGGFLTVQNDDGNATADIDAGSGAVTLTATSVGSQDQILTVLPNAGVIGTGGVTFVADNMTILAPVNAGAQTAALRPFQGGTLIDLGGLDAAGTLGLTDLEIDFVTAGVIRIGDAGSGDLTVTAQIDSANSDQLELVTGGQVLDGFVGIDIIETRLGITASTGVGVLDALETSVSNLEAEANTGGLGFVNSGVLSIGGVNSTLRGLFVNTSGNIFVNNLSTILLIDDDGGQTVKAGDTSGNIFLIANGAAANVSSTVDHDAITAPRGLITVSAAQDILLGTVGLDQDNDVRASGAVTLNAGRDITIDGFTDVVSDDFGQNTGDGVQLSAVRDINITNNNGNDASVGAAGTAGANVLLSTGLNGTLTLTAPNSNAVFSTSGAVIVRADRIVIDASSGITASSGAVSIQQQSPAWAINLGSGTDVAAATLELSDAELDRIFSPTLRIGSTLNSGSITVSAPLTPANVTTLSLRTGGGVLDANAVNPDIDVANVAVRSGNGISLDTAVSSLAFANTGGSVDIRNTGALTIDSVDFITTSFNTGTTTSISAASPLTFAADTTTTGTTTYTAGEIDDAPACADDLTVNSGVTVSVTAGDLILRAGDDIILESGSTVSASGSVSLIAAFNDLDGCGELINNGATISSGTGVTICVAEDLVVGTINAPGQTVTLRSINGAILDGNGAAVNVTAAALAMQANTGIGIGAGGSLETAVTNLEARTQTGGIFVANTGDLTIGGVTPDAACITATLTGLQAVTSGDIAIVNVGSIVLADTDGNHIVLGGSASGNVSLAASGASADLTATVDNNAITAPRGSIAVTAGRDISLGTVGGFDNDLQANGSITLSAGRHITLGGDVDLFSDDFGNSTGGGITATAGAAGGGGNINVIANDASIRASGSGGGGVVLTTGANSFLNLTSPLSTAVFSNSGDVTVNADRVAIAATSGITASSGIVTIQQVSANWAIDLGSITDIAPSTLELSDAELDRIFTSVIRIGSAANTGNITVTAPIDTANTNQLELFTAGSILDGFLGIDLTETSLALTAGTGIGAGNDMDIAVSNLEAQTATGGINIGNFSSVLNIGGVSPALDGVQATTSGDITLTNNGSIILDGTSVEDIRTASGNVIVVAFGATSNVETRNDSADAIDSNLGNVIISAGQDILLGSPDADNFGDVEANGNILLSAGRDIVIDENTFVTATGAGAIAATAGRDISILHSDGTAGAKITTHGGSITLTTGAGGILTVDSDNTSAINSTVTGAADGNITINADRVNITAGDGILAGTGIVTIQQVSPAWAIDLGSATDAAAATLELSDAELDTITAGVLRIGDPLNAGNITFTAQISASAGYDTLHLRTAGSIVDSFIGDDVIVTNLALQAGAGIGVGGLGNICVLVTNLAFSNTAGPVGIASLTSFTINAVDGLNTSTNTGTTTSLFANDGPLTFAVDATSSGDFLARASDTSDAPACEDDLVVNSGVTVQSTAGDLTLQAGDDVVLPLGSTVSAAGTLTITGGFGDVDNCGSVTAFGALAGSTVNIGGGSGDDDFFINPSSAPATVNVSGEAGNDDFFITASATTAFNIDGGPPELPTLPGDSLTIDFNGAENVVFTPAGPGAGTFTSSNRQPITFVSIETLNVFDFGDAPDSYGTLLASDGARHALGSGLRMGASVDSDFDGQPSADALGDDTDSDGDDENGVTFGSSLIAHLDAQVTVNASGAGFVDAWIDFNGDGTFGAGEQIAASFPVVAGNNNIFFNVPAGAAQGTTFSRFRISSSGGLGPTGPAGSGEVEDHAVQIAGCPDNTAKVVADPANPGQRILLVCGTDSNDILIIEPRPSNRVQVRVKNTGKVLGIVHNSEFQSIAAFAKEGNDTIIVDARINKPAQLFGDGGNDQLYGGGGADRLHGGEGSDKLFGGNNHDILSGDGGHDLLSGGNGDDTLDGGEGADQLRGDTGHDRLFGGSGNDFLSGGVGNDRLFGGLDHDRLVGDAGNDILVGQEGNDQLFGGQGRDILIGGDGSDNLVGDQGDDILVAGPTAHDNNELALLSILAEWGSNRSYTARVNNIRTGGGSTNGFALNAGTVFDDFAVDTLSGREGQDWFLFGSGDVLRDKAGNELVN